MSRINETPVYAQRDDFIEAKHYNLWRRARRRFGSPIRIELPGVSGMELLLEDDAWVVVDARQYDVPVLAWTDFQDKERGALHTPVACHLNYYHFAASRLRAKALELMEQALENKLHSA